MKTKYSLLSNITILSLLLFANVGHAKEVKDFSILEGTFKYKPGDGEIYPAMRKGFKELCPAQVVLKSFDKNKRTLSYKDSDSQEWKLVLDLDKAPSVSTIEIKESAKTVEEFLDWCEDYNKKGDNLSAQTVNFQWQTTSFDSIIETKNFFLAGTKHRSVAVEASDYVQKLLKLDSRCRSKYSYFTRYDSQNTFPTIFLSKPTGGLLERVFTPEELEISWDLGSSPGGRSKPFCNYTRVISDFFGTENY